jgi:5-methylcytosine-specific restriction endonuclease McrA
MLLSTSKDMGVACEKSLTVNDCIPNVRTMTLWAEHEHTTSRYPSAAMRDQIIGRDGSRCTYCFERVEHATLDHVVAWSEGGETVATNLVLCCRSCNEHKGSMPVDLFALWLERKGRGTQAIILARLWGRLTTPV